LSSKYRLTIGSCFMAKKRPFLTIILATWF
jgi:hypothetical protein